MTEDPTWARDRRLLAYLGLALVAGGEPVHEVEEQVRRVAAGLGHRDCQVAALPNSLTVALAGGQPASLEMLRTTLTLDQVTRVHTVRQRLLVGELDPDSAIEELRGLRRHPRRFGRWGRPIGLLLVSVGIAAIIQPDPPALLFAAVASQLVVSLQTFSTRHPLIATLLPVVAAFAVAVPALALAAAGFLAEPLLAILPPLAVLLPGALVVTGLSELAAGAMVAGSSRLAYGAVKLLLFTVGVLAALQTVPLVAGPISAVRFSWPFAVAGIMTIALGILLMESVSPALWPWVTAVLVLTFIAQQLGSLGHGTVSVLGGFTGAVVASAGATLVELARPSLPRLVVFLPSFWLLVPGTLGLQSIASRQSQVALTVPPTLPQLGGLVLAIALGLLVGATLVRPAQRWVSQRRAE